MSHEDISQARRREFNSLPKVSPSLQGGEELGGPVRQVYWPLKDIHNTMLQTLLVNNEIAETVFAIHSANKIEVQKTPINRRPWS